ncbi:MAG TPA: hypothetical protein VMV51_14815 [Gemmatimonadaceae bacterium]|nr:hypothetical protein [Gemmatimonadaceae bacterium]
MAPASQPDRPRAGTLARLAALLAVLAALGLVFGLLIRPWYLAWGSTASDRTVALPGDAIIPNATAQETRAITIHAPVDSVWPWVAQLGQDRGGFYSYDLLENLVGCQMPTVDVLRPDKQWWALGDKLWMYPSTKAGGAGYATLRVLVPGHAMAFGTHAAGTPLTAPEDGSWAFALQHVNDSTTRLLVRGRGAAGRSLLGVAFDRSIFEPMHFVMEKRMMTGIKQLSEGQDRGRMANHVQVVLWFLTFAMFIAGVESVFRRAAWRRALTGTAAAAIVFQILTFGQPNYDVGILLALIVATVLWWPVKPGSALDGMLGGKRAA